MSDPMVEVDLTKMTSRQLKNHVSKHPEAMAAVEAEEQKRAAAAKNYEKKSQKKMKWKQMLKWFNIFLTTTQESLKTAKSFLNQRTWISMRKK